MPVFLHVYNETHIQWPEFTIYAVREERVHRFEGRKLLELFLAGRTGHRGRGNGVNGAIDPE